MKEGLGRARESYERCDVETSGRSLAHGCTMSGSDKLCTRCPADLRVKLAKVIVTEATRDVKQKHQERATWRQKRPDAGWRHAGGTPVNDLVIQSDREIWSENSR